MSISSLSRRTHRFFHWLLHIRHRAPKRRKYVLTFASILVMIWIRSSSESFGNGGKAIGWVLLFLLGGVVTTDYDVLKVFGLHGLYDWIQNPDDVIRIVERSYYAKRYVESGDDRIPLTYWKRGSFRALVEDATNLREGMRFWVKVDVPSGERNADVEVPLHLCSVSLDRLVQTVRDGSVEASFSVVRWYTRRSAIDEYERKQYQEILPKIWANNGDIDPYLTIQEVDNLDELDREEWRYLYEGLETVGDEVLDL